MGIVPSKLWSAENFFFPEEKNKSRRAKIELRTPILFNRVQRNPSLVQVLQYLVKRKMSAVTDKFNGRPKRFIKRPDDKAMKQEIEGLKKEIKALDLSNNEINAQINKAVTDSKVVEKRKELQKQLRELINKQSVIKSERAGVMDQIKALENLMKRKIAEIQSQTSKHNFKNVKEIDARVNYLDGLVDAGNLKLADERRYIKEMSSLRKLRKDFGQIEKQQALIDNDKVKILELKKKLSSIQNKEVQKEFEKVQKELDQINDENKSVVNKRNELFDKRNSIKKSKDEKYNQIRKLRAEYDAEFEKFKNLMSEEKKKREEEAKKQQEEEKKKLRKERAEKQLAEASIPAFTDEINTIHTLLTYFDPTYVKPQPKKDVVDAVDTPHSNGRKIEMPDDVVVIKKDTQSFFEGDGKKSSKHKKSKAKKFTVDPSVIVSLSNLSISLPTQSEEVRATITTLKETLDALLEKQEEQTKVNIEKAKAQIAKLEAEEEEEAEENEEAESEQPEN